MNEVDRVSILLADDHVLLSEAISVALLRETDFEVLTARSGDEVLEQIARRGRFDIILLDVQMPGVKTIERVDEVIKANSGGNTVILSSTINPEFIKATINLGGRGFIPKTTPLRSFPSILRVIVSGQTFVPVSLGDENSVDESIRGLSEREMKVLERVAEGESNKSVAIRLGLTESSVKMVMRAICKKLSVKTRTEAAVFYHRHTKD